MKTINRELKDYIEQQILPIYANNDSGHGIEHIQYVVKRSHRRSSGIIRIWT
jgi:muramoyltetrapeptide carboxypeptidase LdcA involved in peptidoglycan recycling